MKTTVCLMNVGLGGNKGAEAMLSSMVQQLHRRFPGIRLRIERPAREPDGIYRERVTAWSNQGLEIDWMDFDPMGRLCCPWKNYRDSKGAKVVPDAVIDLGGLNFQDASLRGSFRTVIRHAPFLARRVPLFFFTQDMGPMDHVVTRFCARVVLGRCRLVFTRSRRTHDLLAGGVPSSDLPLAGPFDDSTFVLEPEHGLASPEAPASIVIGPSRVIERMEPEAYQAALRGILRILEGRYPVTLMAHTFGDGRQRDDADLCRDLKREFPWCELHDANRPVEELKAIIGQARFVISSRFHMLVAALGQGVPVIALGWNPKYASLLESFSIPYANLGLGMDNMPGEVLALLDKLDTSVIRTNLSIKADEARVGAMRGYDRLEMELSGLFRGL